MLTKIVYELAMMPNKKWIAIFVFWGVIGVLFVSVGLFRGSPVLILAGMFIFFMSIAGLSKFM